MSKSTGTLILDSLKPAKRLFLFSTGTGFAPFSSIIRDPETYDKFEKIIDIDVKTLDPYSHNALEHTPIIVSSNDMNAFRDALSYMLSNGSNLVLNKATMNISNTDKPNTVRLFITYLNYSDS